MSSSPLGGSSREGRILGPALDKILKNVAWRKHSSLVSAAKSALDLLSSSSSTSPPSSSTSTSFSDSPLPSFSASSADLLLLPLSLALDASYPKLAEPALSALHRLLAASLLRLHVSSLDPEDPDHPPSPSARLLLSLCRFSSSPDSLSDEALEISALRTLLSAARCPSSLLRSDPVFHLLKSCFHLYLSSSSPTTLLSAKASAAFIASLAFSRAESSSLLSPPPLVSIHDLLLVSDKNLNDPFHIQFAQSFIAETISIDNSAAAAAVAEAEIGEVSGDQSMESVLTEDAIALFKNLCKFSMKSAAQEDDQDYILLRGKVLALELLNVILNNAGPMWRMNEKFTGAVKQYLCLSILKNSALSAMSTYQLLCSIFTSLLLKFRSELKSEIGIFFPILVLRVLENVLQPSFLQKMTVVNLLEKICQDSQLIVDVFVNYDSDVDAPNIFERIVNGLLKTALGAPSGSTTTLSSAQDMTLQLESVKCLVAIIKTMGTWMDQQLHIADFSPLKNPELDASAENHAVSNMEEGAALDCELHTEFNPEQSEAATLEQRRALKMEIQKGVALFNRKPSKGIEYLINAKRLASTPAEVASFLKGTTGLSETMIGDYLGEREEFPLKVMHAYVDAMNFEGMDFDEAIRFFLQGFRLPGEAQKIDRIMEKFAERYCKCNPSSFTSADTAYVLAYSVIMLNTDAHNTMVKDKMSKAVFICNNRGIDDGKDLPGEYLGSLYDQIVKNEIKMKADPSIPQSKQANSINKLMGLDSIINLVTGKHAEEKALGANGTLLRDIREQFKAKAGKSESVFYAVTDAAILRFVMEVCWAPMLAAFSMILDRSDDKDATYLCLQGFRHAIHVTSVVHMQTQRDAFVTSVAKFTYLHCAADMKQKNIDAVKAIMSIAVEDGNYLEESWEHILTCLSRFEHLQLLGEGAPLDVSFFTVPLSENEEKLKKSSVPTLIKNKGNALQSPAVMAVVRGGSYDSTTLGFNKSSLATPEQINNFISNLNLLEQIGSSELSYIFAHSQRLNGEAIVAFVKALCNISTMELQSRTDPRVFCLTKIVEIAHYNMGRIRLVWSRIWNVLSGFFVKVGLSKNLSVAIFVMDSLRQLAMKFLEKEELANYNFQNEFLRPFVIVMQKSSFAEIRELIVRCVSQMVLSRVNNVKSGWKGVFMVFTIAAADERKAIVLLAFETMEKIVRDYFPYITETQSTTFTDCVKCLITFTSSRFDSDISLNAIAFLRFCAVKLAEGGLICSEKSKETDSSVPGNVDAWDANVIMDKDDHVYYWVPLLTGLSKLTSDPRPSIRKCSLEVLFNILRDHGQLFSCKFWAIVLKSAVFPIFGGAIHASGTELPKSVDISQHKYPLKHEDDPWTPETYSVAAQCLVDLFVNFYDVLQSKLSNVVSILTSFLQSPDQSSASTGVTALVSLAGSLGNRLQEKEWGEIFLSLKEAAESTLPEFLKLVKVMDDIEVADVSHVSSDVDLYSDQELANDESEDDSLATATFIVTRMKGHIAVQLLILQAVLDIYKAHHQSLSASNLNIIMGIFSMIAAHALGLNSEGALQRKLRKVCNILEIADPPMVHFENESHQNYLKFMLSLLTDNPSLSKEIGVESQLVTICETILKLYLNCAQGQSKQFPSRGRQIPLWIFPLGLAKKEELVARTPLVVFALQVLSSLEKDLFKGCLPSIFPLLVGLVRSEHSSGDVQQALFHMFQSVIGRVLMNL